ncbi:MAG: hypothetical protein HY319_29330 [Armatimonadetes bacterium]|nr:hypothetical protein [Armatimonadota bacterium]
MSKTETPLPRGWLAAAALLGAATVLPFFADDNAGVNDEALNAVAATRLLEGEAPYRDFHMRSNPGTYTLLWALYRVLGPSLTTNRLMVVLMAALMCLALGWLSQKLLPDRWPALPVLLFGFTGVTHFAVVNHHWLGVLCFLAGLMVLVHWVEHPGSRTAACLGGMLALGWWCLQSDAGALGLAALTVLLVQRPPGWIRDAAVSAAAFLLVSLILWTPVLLRADPSLVVELSIREPLRYHGPFNRSLYSWSPLVQAAGAILDQLGRVRMDSAGWLWLGHAVSYLGVWIVKHGALYLVVLGAFYVLAREPRSQPLVRTVLIAYLALLFVSFGRQDMLYTNYLTPLHYLFLAWLLARYAPRPLWWAAGLLALFGIQYGFGVLESRRAVYPIHTARGTLYSADPARAQGLTELYRLAGKATPPGTKTLAYPYAPAFTFYSGTRSVMRPPIILPLHNSEAEFQQLLEDVARERPPYIYHLPLGPEALSAYPTVDRSHFWSELARWNDQLFSGYQPVGRVGGAVIYRRK